MIFYIDTTSSFLYTAIYQEGRIINSKSLNLNHDLSTFAVDEVNKMFSEVGLLPKDMEKIMVVNGPGSFTGIRIGVTLAKIFAYTLKKDITTISSLEAMNKSVKCNTLTVPIIDARRGYCYASIYDDDKVILNDCYISLEKLMLILHGLGKEYTFISNDKFDFYTVKYQPDYQRIIDFYKDRDCVNPHLVNPIYLKLTEAEENKMKEVKE